MREFFSTAFFYALLVNMTRVNKASMRDINSIMFHFSVKVHGLSRMMTDVRKPLNFHGKVNMDGESWYKAR